MPHWLIYRRGDTVRQHSPLVIHDPIVVEAYRTAGHIVLGPFDLTQVKS